MEATTISAGEARQQFLQLLIAQLQHQDPLEPVGQQEFLQQLAQFSTVEGIEQLNLRFADLLKLQELTQGAQLVGRLVEYDGADGPLRGVIASARSSGGEVLLEIDGRTVPLDSLRAVLHGV